MTEEDTDPGWVGLTEAIQALRDALVAASWDGQQRRVRFKVDPVELTMQVGVTRVGKGSAGIRWHVLALGGERSREAVSTQTLKLRLAPVLFDENGRVLPEAEQLISDRDDLSSADRRDAPAHERE
jgi:hypothetical protein